MLLLIVLQEFLRAILHQGETWDRRCDEKSISNKICLSRICLSRYVYRGFVYQDMFIEDLLRWRQGQHYSLTLKKWQYYVIQKLSCVKIKGKMYKSLINISNVHLLITDQTTRQKPAKSLINIPNVHLLTDQTTQQKPAKSSKMKEHRHRTEKLVKCKIKVGLSVLYTFGIST